MSETLINQNQIAIETWQKPSDWVDIRSGALPNSIYFLVGHSADFTKYPEFSFNATISNSGTYDVFVDGVKQATTASGSDTLFNWQTLNLDSGFDVTYPEALKTHIVRVTPSSSSNTIVSFHLTANSSVNQGVLWEHFTITNKIQLFNFNYNNNTKCELLEAVTSGSGILMLTGHNSNVFAECINLKTVPIIDNTNNSGKTSQFFLNCKKLKYIKLTGDSWANNIAWYGREFEGCESLEQVDSPILRLGWATFAECKKLKRFNAAVLSNAEITGTFEGCYSLEPFFIDTSNVVFTSRYIRILGSSTNQRLNLIGLVVNPNSTFTSRSPQINVSYTNMNRGALVNLFNSLPTVTGGQVCDVTGASGAADLSADDLAIATAKGWTVTR